MTVSLANIAPLFQLIASLSVLFVSMYVFRWSRRKDKNDLVRSPWADAQSINIATISKLEIAGVIERAIYGKDPEDEEQRIIVDYFLFLYLNTIKADWLCLNYNLLSRSRYLFNSQGSLNLISGQKERVMYLVAHRGYSDEFALEIFKRLDDEKTTAPPHWDSLDDKWVKVWQAEAESRIAKIERPTPKYMTWLGFPPKSFQ